MIRLSRFQLYSILIIMLGPIPFLEIPKRITDILFNNACLAILAAVIPGLLIAAMFERIIKKSTHPFPILMEEHFGTILGKILAFIYIPIFLLISAFFLRLFVDFVDSNVLPQTPVSFFIGSILVVGYLGIKAGLSNFARVCEIIICVGLPFSFLIVILSIIQKPDIGNIMPLGFMKFTDFLVGTASVATITGLLFPVTSLAFFLPNQQDIGVIMRRVLYIYTLLMMITTLATILHFGGDFASILTFPTFMLVRIISIGDFLTNLDIVFIGIWILGIFGSVTIPWFMACYTTQQIFRLKGYSFIAAPSSLIIGVLSLLISNNILELEILSKQVMPYLYTLFFIFLPFLLYLFTLFKPNTNKKLPGNTLSEEQAE